MINKNLCKNISIIYNINSGSFNRDKLNKFIEFLKLNNFIVDSFCVKNEKDISSTLNLLDFRKEKLLIFASGDGTINTAINHLHNNKYIDNIILAVLPMGTANVLAMELNTETINKLKQAILKWDIVPLHIGKITNLQNNKSRFFSLMASIGFDSISIKNIKYYRKFIFGKFSYILTYVINFFCKSNKYKFKTIVNGKEFENCFTCVSNGRFYGIKKEFTTADITENNFDVVIAKKTKLFSFLKFLKFKKSNEDIELLKSNKIYIENTNPSNKISFQIDGDCFFEAPAIIETTNFFINILKNK